MGNKAMPYNCLKGLRMRSHARRLDCGHHYDAIAYQFGIASIATDDTEYLQPALLRLFRSRHYIGADVLLRISATYGENKYRVVGICLARAQPGRKNRIPAFIIGPRRQLGNVVYRGVGLDAAKFSEIVDRVTAIGGASTHSQKK